MKQKKKAHKLNSCKILILTVFVTILGCSFDAPSSEFDKNNSISQLPLLTMEYDNTKVTTSTQWPENIISPAGRTTNNNSEYLIDYASTHTTFTIDDSGYIGVRTDWLEGNASITMPIEMWNDAEDKTHPFHPSHNPMVAYEFDHGVYNVYGEDGSVIHTSTYPADSMRINTDIINLDSIGYYFGGASIGDSTENRMGELLASFQAIGYSAQPLGDSEIRIEKETSDGGNTKIILNSRTGLMSRSAIYNSDNELSLVTLYSYTPIDGFYMPVQTINYEMGEGIDGTRGIKQKTIETRTNINLQFHENGE